MKNKTTSRYNLRATDQETARVVGIYGHGDIIVGSGCLLNGRQILTCYHVAEAALGVPPKSRETIDVWPIGVGDQLRVRTKVVKLGDYARYQRSIHDLALLELDEELGIPSVEFATPLRHGSKKYSVLGFPDGDPQGRNASGRLHAANAAGLVQMDGNSALFVKGGFSGAPVWSADVGAFVGMVVTELYDNRVAWCIPSRVLCRFSPDLPVKFRIPPADRPVVHDYWEDDPNEQLFGTVSDNGERLLTAVIKEREKDYKVGLTFEACEGAGPLRGGFVTFITFPDFADKSEDAYELFAPIKDNKAQTYIKPGSLFTVAAIGDGGDTALTLNLETCLKKKSRNADVVGE